MGSASYTTQHPGVELRATFEMARDQDEAEYGSSGYTGTISQASGAHQVTTRVCHPLEAERLAELLLGWEGQVLSRDSPQLVHLHPTARARRAEAARERAAELVVDALGGAAAVCSAAGSEGQVGGMPPLDMMLPGYVHESRGDVAAIPFAEPGDFEEVTHRVTVDGEAGAALACTRPESLEVLHALRERLPAGARIAKIGLVSEERTVEAVTEPVTGEVTATYQVFGVYGSGTRSQMPLPGSYATVEEAAKAAAERAATPAEEDRHFAAFEVRATLAADGPAVARVARRVTGWTLTYDVVTVHPRADALAVTGWMFAGTARC